MPNSDKPELPKRILKHADQVFEGPNGHIWKKTISLPRDLRVKFPNSLEDEERNVEGNMQVFAHKKISQRKKIV